MSVEIINSLSQIPNQSCRIECPKCNERISFRYSNRDYEYH